MSTGLPHPGGPEVEHWDYMAACVEGMICAALSGSTPKSLRAGVLAEFRSFLAPAMEELRLRREEQSSNPPVSTHRLAGIRRIGEKVAGWPSFRTELYVLLQVWDEVVTKVQADPRYVLTLPERIAAEKLRDFCGAVVASASEQRYVRVMCDSENGD
jgi:hypothetical protein